ncbi:2,3-bisphosphoglycerate-independent phosphoglycerate mutase [Linum perenne]
MKGTMIDSSTNKCQTFRVEIEKSCGANMVGITMKRSEDTIGVGKPRIGVCEIMGSPEQPKRRVAFVLIDGIGDVSLPRLGYKTPLEAADVPNLDAIASAGVNGLMDPVEVGLGCGSDTAHLSLMGYDPRVYYRGRGAFESMGAGLAMSPGDIAFKVTAMLFYFHQ